VLINWRIKGLKTKAAAAPVNNFYPQKRERKKEEEKKEKYSYLIRLSCPEIGLQKSKHNSGL